MTNPDLTCQEPSVAVVVILTFSLGNFERDFGISTMNVITKSFNITLLHEFRIKKLKNQLYSEWKQKSMQNSSHHDAIIWITNLITYTYFFSRYFGSQETLVTIFSQVCNTNTNRNKRESRGGILLPWHSWWPPLYIYETLLFVLWNKTKFNLLHSNTARIYSSLIL